MTTVQARSTLTYTDPKRDREERMRPLSLSLILRLIGYMRPHAKRRNVLLVF